LHTLETKTLNHESPKTQMAFVISSFRDFVVLSMCARRENGSRERVGRTVGEGRDFVDMPVKRTG
jgi:hypothetical protein